MSNIRISVVMSVYNGEKYLKEAVGSILNQSFTDFEFIIIDDGSTDNSLAILRQFESSDKRIKIISRGNKGLLYSLNQGIDSSQAEFIARMDTDDIAKPERLEKQLLFMQNNNLTLCGTWAEGIDELGEKIKDMNYPPISDGKIKVFALLHTPFIHPSVMFRKDIFDKVGGFKMFFKHIEDYELWTRIVFKYKTGNLPEQLLRYRFHGDQITKKNNLSMRMRGILVRILALGRFVFRF